MNDQAMKFRLGVFILGAGILLAVLIILFGEFPTIFTRQQRFVIKFKEAPGVEQGTPVRKSGVRIGDVAGFDLDPDSGEVTVQVVVERKYSLRMSDQVLLGRGLVMGDTTINFLPVEGADPTRAPEGHVFRAEPFTDIRQTIGRASDLLPITQATLEEIRATSKTVNEFVPQLRRTNDEIQVAARNFGNAFERIDNLIQTNEAPLTRTLEKIGDVTDRFQSLLSDANQKNLTTTLKNAAAASEQFDKTMKNVDVLVTDARKTLKTTGDQLDTSLKRADEVLTDLRSATKPFAEQGPAIMKNLEESTARLNEFSKHLTEGDGTLRRIVDDPALYNSLNDTATNLNRSMMRLERILRDVEVFADKIARHPELLGIGGAVSPSSGLKQSPIIRRQ